MHGSKENEGMMEEGKKEEERDCWRGVKSPMHRPTVGLRYCDIMG